MLGALLGDTNLTGEVIQAMSPMWARGTWAARGRIWRQLVEFAAARGAAPTAMMAVRMLTTKTNTVQSKHTEAKSVMALLRQMGQQTRPIELYVKALQAQGALEPVRQAKPITQAQMLRVAAAVPVDARTAVQLTWKAASRWSETAGLTRDQFVEVTPNQVVISWGRSTKSSRLQPFRESMYTVIQGSGTDMIARAVKHMKPGRPLTTTTTEQLNRVMRRVLGPGYTSHSIKHGAITELFRHVAAGKLTIPEVMRLAKHKQVETTLRYVGSPVDAAMALGTQRATQLL